MSFDVSLTPPESLAVVSRARWGAKVPRYRCYFLAGESIKAAENIDASDDAGALLEARVEEGAQTVTVLRDDVPADRREQVARAVKHCPTHALSLEPL